MNEGQLKRGERVTMTAAAIAAGLGSVNGLREGIVTSVDNGDGLVGVKILGGNHSGGSQRYATKFWIRQTPVPTDADLIAVLCRGCGVPHPLMWRCGSCKSFLKESLEFEKPTWPFCPWCGSKLADRGATV